MNKGAAGARWQAKRLDEVCEIIMGQSPDGDSYNVTGEGVPLINGPVEFSQGAFGKTTRSKFTTEPTKLCRENDLILCVRGSTTGRMNIAGFDACVGRGVAAIRAKEYQPWINHFISSKRDDIHRLGTGATFPNVSGTMLNDLQLPFPPLPEQRRIVGILDEAFDGIATAKANAEKNLQNARALFESHLYGVDAEKAPLGDLVKITTGKLDANAAVDDGQYPFFTCSREVYAIDDYAFDCEAILLAGNNAVGDFNVKHYKGKFNAYQRTYVITVNEDRRLLYRFLYFQILKSLKGFKAQSVGAGTKFLKLGMIKELEIALPSLPEQQRIVSTMDSVRKETQRLESNYQQKLAALDALKKSLLDQAFTGVL
jgi:type I restriction enzyme S subunit